MASWNHVSVYAPKTSFGIGGASALPLPTQMLAAFRSPLLLPLLSPMPLLDHLQIPGPLASARSTESIGSTGEDADSIAPTHDYASDATAPLSMVGSATG